MHEHVGCLLLSQGQEEKGPEKERTGSGLFTRGAPLIEGERNWGRPNGKKVLPTSQELKCSSSSKLGVGFLLGGKTPA